jgi:hypothetical protein
MRTVTVRTDETTEGDLALRYALSTIESPHAAYRATLYRVSVCALASGEGRKECAEQDFADPGHALIFYELCLTHRVLPIHLGEVREDFEH